MHQEMSRWAFVALAMGLGGCATLPPPGPARALYVDLDQLVAGRERTDWVVDRVELEAVADDLMRSVCATPLAERARLGGWLAARQGELGEPEALWRSAGGDLALVQPALHLARVRKLLAHGQTIEGECPFWLPPTEDFGGVHADADRFILQAETMGAFQLVLAEGADPAVGGAGLVRLLPGYGLNHHLTVLLGLEMGVASELDRGEGGEVQLTPGFAAGVPLVLRVHVGSLRWDTGVSLTGRSKDPDFSNPRMGLRWDQSIGVATLRVAGVQPYVMIWAGHEWLPETDSAPRLHSLRMGSRVGISWDP
ncbi:MAG: hypothetical protein H6706_31125 [Myxococcales bacterium]|nr:hypothetical protein [Myxococcales bacterium]